MKNFLKRVLGISLVLIASTFAAEAQSAPSSSAEPSTVNQQARYWFRNTKFGLFIHWGRYSVPAAGEWVMETRHIPVSEDEKSAPQFNPQGLARKRLSRWPRAQACSTSPSRPSITTRPGRYDRRAGTMSLPGFPILGKPRSRPLVC